MGLCAAAGATFFGVCSVGTLAHAQDQTDNRSFSITPTIGVQGSYTDNANLTARDREGDFIGRGMVGLDANLNRGRAVGRVTTQISYDRYAKNTELSGASVSANGAGSYSLIPGTLSIDAEGTITNGLTSTFGASAVDRSGVNGRTQLGLYHIGPRLETTLGGFADLAAAARFAQVFYSTADASVVDTPLPSDSDIVQVVGRIDTAERFRGYELLTTGQFEKDNHGYRTANGVQSVFVNVLPSIRLIARGGYESVFQPGITDIDAAIYSGGLEVTLNRLSTVSVEVGERYNRTAWAAKADVRMSDRFFLTATYTEAIQPDQVLVANSFREFVVRTANLPPPVVPGGFSITGNIYNQTSFNKIAELHLVYGTDHQAINWSVNWSDRNFLPSDTHDRTIVTNLAYHRALRRDLSLILDLSYARTFESPLYGQSESYGFLSRLYYRLNSTMDLNASYALAYGQQLFPGGQVIYDNTFLISIQKRF